MSKEPSARPPQYTDYINPVLEILKKLGGSARPSEVCPAIAKDLSLPDPILEERLTNGVSRFENQVHWARFYLVKDGYIDSSRRGVWSLTEKGRTAARLSEGEIRGMVRRVQETTARPQAVEPSAAPAGGVTAIPIEELTLPEMPDATYREQLLATMKSLPPGGFERLCQRLLRESDFEEVVVTGRSGDGGLDGHGVLQINPFVSFRVYFQCKRYDGSVGAGAVRDFRGAMMGRADKGLILSTGTFSPDAKREAIRDGVPPIELVDGERLIEMFEKLELGLKPRTTYDLDPEFFRPFQT
ncbi:MAG: restriction endonuclease [Nitrospira sp.]|nr:restriction endonuclease [Nitrospira sp.]